MTEKVTVRRDGVTADLLLWERYGQTSGLEELLDLNPGLAELGAYLPLLTVATLPEAPPEQLIVPVIRLWSE